MVPFSQGTEKSGQSPIILLDALSNGDTSKLDKTERGGVPAYALCVYYYVICVNIPHSTSLILRRDSRDLTAVLVDSRKAVVFE